MRKMIRTKKNGTPILNEAGEKIWMMMSEEQIINLGKIKGHSGWMEDIERGKPKEGREVTAPIIDYYAEPETYDTYIKKPNYKNGNKNKK